MKLTYLGTAAAEGFPALFCNCKYCIEARKKGGKNIRTRSQALIDNQLLIDLPPDTYMHFLNGNVRFDAIHTLIITHGHSDHFYAKELKNRHSPYAHDMKAKKLQVYCSKVVFDLFVSEVGSAKLDGVDFNIFFPYQTFSSFGYKITPLPARHMQEGEAFIFLIEKDNKKILYAHDTGYFYDHVFKYLEENSITLDLISYDCTNVENSIPDTYAHMGFENIARLREKLKKIGAINNKTIEFVNHFSHNGNPDQSMLEKIAKPLGLRVAFDGCSVTV